MAEIKPRYLVMVTASANNNKYYKQIPHGDSWTAEYGRVGSSPQRREYSMSQWESKYKEKLRKGYVDQSELVEDLIQVEKPKNSEYKEIENKENIVNKNINTYEQEDGVDIYVTYEVLENIGTNEKIVF